ncbi:MAG: phosphoribosyl-ATP diphosphatase [Firmicutes bacterium]|nr:phosphoribosyl-ATP diphosphatase [Bacillota bacterium]
MSIGKALEEEFAVIKKRQLSPEEGSYTSYLFGKGTDKILKKIGEEATETVIAAKNEDNSELVGEICDLLFHTEVLMAQKNLSWDDVCAELERRRQKENMNVEKEEKRKRENRTDECNIN